MSSVSIAREGAVGFEIEPMLEHDLLEVVEIEETCGLSLWGWDGYHTELGRRESIMLVARLGRHGRGMGRALAGFIAARVDADELHVNNIGVREEARRGGLGCGLLCAALARGALYGAERGVLEVRASNLPAQALYAAHGFEAAGRRKNYYRSPAEDALVMTLDFRRHGLKAG